MSSNKRLSMQKPTKPASGYNIFYQGATKRARKREEAQRIFNERIMRMSADAQPGATNKTKLIGGQWKTLQPHTRDLFAIRSKDELEMYHTSKTLWSVLERILQPLNPVEDQMSSNAKQGGKAQAPPPMDSEALALRNEMQRQLCLFLL